MKKIYIFVRVTKSAPLSLATATAYIRDEETAHEKLFSLSCSAAVEPQVLLLDGEEIRAKKLSPSQKMIIALAGSLFIELIDKVRERKTKEHSLSDHTTITLQEKEITQLFA